jgi:excisionase family DNA binding protein
MSRLFPVYLGTKVVYYWIMERTREIAVDAAERLLLKADEVARRLSLGRATVYLMIASGELPTLRKGRAVRVPARALERWIDERTTAGGA